MLLIAKCVAVGLSNSVFIADAVDSQVCGGGFIQLYVHHLLPGRLRHGPHVGHHHLVDVSRHEETQHMPLPGR